MRTALWSLILVAAGTASAFLTTATGLEGDFFDSPWLPVVLFGLLVLAALAGWTAAAGRYLWGLLAMAPLFVTLAIGVAGDFADGTGDGLFVVGLIILVVATAPIWAAGLIAGALRRSRQHSATPRT